jgi:Flp pilus assembly pilin Flp
MLAPESQVVPLRLAGVPAPAGILRGDAVRVAGVFTGGSFLERNMRTLLKNVRKLHRDERGGEVMEYALILGLIVVAAIAVVGAVGTKVVARWNSVNSSM